jgi:hypothetical protein
VLACSRPLPPASCRRNATNQNSIMKPRNQIQFIPRMPSQWGAGSVPCKASCSCSCSWPPPRLGPACPRQNLGCTRAMSAGIPELLLSIFKIYWGWLWPLTATDQPCLAHGHVPCCNPGSCAEATIEHSLKPICIYDGLWGPRPCHVAR